MRSDAAKLCVVLLFVLALRLPFLNQAIQGDDVYYLYGAEHAQIDPLHPKNVRFVFAGETVDMRGHPHGPLNSWVLGGLLVLLGDVREVPFHLAYVVFSLIAAWAMWSLALRFCERPLLATLLFCVVPAFVINGTSLEADLPFLALWMVSVALFVGAVDTGSGWMLAGSAVAGGAASLAAYQAVLLTPILAVYLWQKRREWSWGWVGVLAAPVVVVGWQVWERWSTGALPASILAGYLQPLEVVTQKTRSAVALLVHAGWIVSPVVIMSGRWPVTRIVAVGMAVVAGAFYDWNPLFLVSLAGGVSVLLWAAEGAWKRDYLGYWIVLFFIAAVVIFFAGSVRYLLPMAAPVVLLAVRRVSGRWLWVGFGLQLVLSMALAAANYQHWDAYREVARSLEHTASTQRVWINGEWGLRFYLEADGALALTKNQRLVANEIVVTSALSTAVRPVSPLALMREQVIAPSIPLRLISLAGRSAYSSAARGLLPFEISREPADRVRIEVVRERNVQLSYLDPQVAISREQFLSGLFEDGWMGAEASVILKSPAKAGAVRVEFYIPPGAPTRKVELSVGGRPVAEDTFAKPGAYALAAPISVTGATSVVTVKVDKTYRVAGDERDLGVKIVGIGFR